MSLLESHLSVQKKKVKSYHQSQDTFQTSMKTDIDQVKEILDRSILSNAMVENLINDLLDIAQIENGKYKLNEDYFDLKSCIKDTLDIVLY